MSPTCFDALDAQVIQGHADLVALRAPGRDWTYAQLLEEVAACGGVLRHCGVVAGDRVAVSLPSTVEAVVAVLACARIGVTHVLGSAGGKVLITDGPGRGAAPDAGAEVVLVKQVPGVEVELRGGREHDWDVVMRAGRTDPAAWVEGATFTPYDEQTRAWVEPLLAGGTLELSGPGPVPPRGP